MGHHSKLIATTAPQPSLSPISKIDETNPKASVFSTNPSEKHPK